MGSRLPLLESLDKNTNASPEQAVLDAFPDLLLFIDDQGIVRDTRGGCSGAFHPFADAHGRDLGALLPRSVARSLLDAVRTGLPGSLEFVVPGSLGVRRFEARVVPESGCVVIRETPESQIVETEPADARSRLEAQLDRTSELLSQLIDSLDAGILVEDDEGRIAWVNRSFCRIFGIDAVPADLRGLDSGEAARTSLSLLADPQEFQAEVQSCLASGIPRCTPRVRFADGRVFERDYLPFSATQSCRGHLWQYREITDRLAVEEVHRETESRLREAQKREAVGLLAGGVAHEFNNNLTAILGFAELLLCGASLSETDRHRIAAIRSAGERASSLTQQLLSFSRKRVVQPRVIDLNETIEGLWGILSRLLGERSSLEVVTESGPVWIHIDPGDIEHLLMNLALNARDAMPDGGCLRVETKRLGDRAQLLVRDNGVGMDPQTASRIFEPFFTTKDVGEGTGLGLAIVREILDDAGGEITVESAPGKGTVFLVELVARDRAGPREERAPRDPLTRGEETVLIVEDELAVRNLLTEVLREQGYDVLSCASASLAVEQLRAGLGKPDLVLSDVVLPGMNGPELVEHLSGILPDVPVILMSGYPEDPELEKTLRDDSVSFVAKPFTPKEILGEIRRRLEG